MTNTGSPGEFFPPHHRKGLFYSDAWINAWLKAYSDHPDIQINPVGFYTSRKRLKRLLPVTTATPTGATSVATRSIRAEYLCLADTPSRDATAGLMAQLCSAKQWHQLYLPDIMEDSPELPLIVEAAKRHGLHVREQERDTAYAVDLRGSNFEHYLATLGKNTRLKLYNRRKKLEESGEVSLENWWPKKSEFFKLLNDFHLARWNKQCYRERNLTFIDTLLQGLSDNGATIDLSVLSLSGKPVSVALDITASGRCYNLQAGYIEEFIKNVSLGTLHLGYQIEKAFLAGSEVYDFMAGQGKNSQYKASLANTHSDMLSLMLVRHPLLKLAYRVKSKRMTP